MRKLFTLIIFGLVFSQLTARSYTTGGNETSAANSTENITESLSVHLYPNPVEDQLNFTATDRMIGNTIRIYNLLGSEMDSRSINSGHESIDISSLQTGLYLYSIIDKNNKAVVAGKFNKQ